ncbi:histidine kinase [Desulforamulus ferrireducens]|uniref:Histidine kinase n=1 Tax=Desulforamulus ferrireducens TaxID=1833852 RepID=A0A1S6J0R7_9FIRM|nr:histidine kinase [Desulforamulus ferrireducens]
MEEKTIEIELCSQLFDRLTIIKGYLMLNVERKKIDYTPLILREVDEMERLLQQVVDDIRNV